MENKLTNKFAVAALIFIIGSLVIDRLTISSTADYHQFFRFVFTVGSTWFFIWTGKTLTNLMGKEYTYEAAVVTSALAFLVGMTCEVLSASIFRDSLNSCAIVAMTVGISSYLLVLGKYNKPNKKTKNMSKFFNK